MRQVINGKVYDTETAQRLHSWENGHSANDFKYRSKDLYRSRKGAYFLLHEGGPLTDMAKSVGDNGWGGSTAIEPIDRATAMRFLESHGGSEVLVREFADALEEA